MIRFLISRNVLWYLELVDVKRRTLNYMHNKRKLVYKHNEWILLYMHNNINYFEFPVTMNLETIDN